jgi:hypothetical protein
MAGQMKLFEFPDFLDLIQATQGHFEHLGLTETLIEKDYYVTEALRIVATQYPEAIIFKGGTSLSKAWNLIQRFSEDIDLFLNKQAFQPPIGENRTDKILKEIVTKIEEHPTLTLDVNQTKSKKGIYRHAYFDYPQQTASLNVISNQIFLEIGTRSGTFPVEICRISSYVSQFLQASNDSLGAEDETSFAMLVLHYRRTFVEKLFAIHTAIVNFENQKQPIGNQIRHYYDTYCLLQTADVQNMLKTKEYQDIKEDISIISQSSFPQAVDYLPQDLNFSQSPAFNLHSDTKRKISQLYQGQLRLLCYGTCPSWETIQETIHRFQNDF